MIAGRDGAEHEAELRQAEIDQQHLQQQRRAAEERDVEGGDAERHAAADSRPRAATSAITVEAVIETAQMNEGEDGTLEEAALAAAEAERARAGGSG